MADQKHLAMAFEGLTLVAPIPEWEKVVPYVKATKEAYQADPAIPPFRVGVHADPEKAVELAEAKLAA